VQCETTFGRPGVSRFARGAIPKGQVRTDPAYEPMHDRRAPAFRKVFDKIPAYSPG
jgi:hypothetical protein